MSGQNAEQTKHGQTKDRITCFGRSVFCPTVFCHFVLKASAKNCWSWWLTA